VKLLFPTVTFAKKAMIQLQYHKAGLFFLGEQPPVPALLAFEFPGLKSQDPDAVTRWMIAHHRKTPPTSKADKKRADAEETSIPREMWRRAVLDDYLDATNATSYLWHASQYFSLDELATFAETHGPPLDRALRAAMKHDRDARPAQLAKVVKRAEIVVPLVTAAQRRISVDLEELKAALDREAVAKLTKAKRDVSAWISACAELRTDVVKAELMVAIAKRLVAECDEAGITEALDQMVAKNLHKVYVTEFFTILGDKLPLPQNTTGETIDLTRATETTIAAAWPAYMAKRVGPVKIGRSALYSYVKKGKDYVFLYVRGERKLKHRIKKRGGSIQRWGNTLTVGVKDPSSVHAQLLRVDEIDSLAQLAPARAVALLGDLAPTPKITEALAHAETDPRWRRILSDLLIEHIVGIDADVARRLARAEASANRRSR
jgi:hypothetical protein